MDQPLITVAIIGAGPLGRRLALRAAQAGFRVFLEDVMPANLRHAEESLRTALSEENMPLVRFVSTVEDAVREADIAIDCVPDELESKLEIFCLLDRMSPPRTVFATPTTNLSIADLASCTYRPTQCVAIALAASRLALDPAVEPLIPICITPQTSVAAQTLITDFFVALGYHAQLSLDAAIPLR
ncbi:MAG TPA: 3-hydroxyacyl-CoA dehydrogenase NAD-binding domain-containing protein [Acidobacteriaceae bacterium]|nr:3-hydroxyacyl-CoA dehydrogenase NAD-binding domain-containing protein [Acidobacteriaceae bacterium]